MLSSEPGVYEFIVGDSAVVLLLPDETLNLTVLLEVGVFPPFGAVLGGVRELGVDDDLPIFEAELLFEDGPYLDQVTGELEEGDEPDELSVFLIIEEAVDQQKVLNLQDP